MTTSKNEQSDICIPSIISVVEDGKCYVKASCLRCDWEELIPFKTATGTFGNPVPDSTAWRAGEVAFYKHEEDKALGLSTAPVPTEVIEEREI